MHIKKARDSSALQLMIGQWVITNECPCVNVRQSRPLNYSAVVLESIFEREKQASPHEHVGGPGACRIELQWAMQRHLCTQVFALRPA